MTTPASEKDIATACARAALAGILATPSRDDRGVRTVVLTRAHWTREVLLQDLAAALAEAKVAIPGHQVSSRNE